jgi:hypothetical protein
VKNFLCILLIGLMASLVGCSDDANPASNNSVDDIGLQNDDAGEQDDSGWSIHIDAGEDAFGGDAEQNPDGASTTYPDDITFEDYREEYRDHLLEFACNLTWRCEAAIVRDLGLSGRFNSREECIAQTQTADPLTIPYANETNEFKRLIDAGRIIFESEEAAACLNAFANLDATEFCSNRDLEELADCSDPEAFLTGTIGEGGTCLQTVECAGDDLYCDSSADTCGGTCTVDEPYLCGGVECAEDQYCRADSGGALSCATRETEGSLCRGDYQCGEGLKCLILDGESSGVCLSAGSRAQGEACESDFYCSGNDLCVDETCVEFAFTAEGEACDPDAVCEPGTNCIRASVDAVIGTCMPSQGVGNPCLSPTDCNLNLFCDRPSYDRMGSCARPKEDGSTCESSNECRSQNCASGICGPDPSSQCPIPS